LNRHLWKDLEGKVRDWATQYDKVYVTTGPILSKEDLKLPNTSISIPQSFYKVILEVQEPEIKAIGFIIPQDFDSSEPCSYAMSVADVEKATGIDFFPALPDDIERKVESDSDFSQWCDLPVQLAR